MLKRYDPRGSEFVLRIGIIGDFNSKNLTHLAINAAIEHTGRSPLFLYCYCTLED